MEPFAPGILHATDFSESSRVAFAHALAITLAQQGKLTLLNAKQDMPTVEDWERFPSVRDTLERWGLLEAGSSRADVYRELAVKVKKVAVDDSAVDAIVGYLDDNPNDLLVLATDQREGFLNASVAQEAARHSHVDTLFVPEGSPGFVAIEDGSLSLRRILVPVAETPSAAPAIGAASRAAHWLGVPPVTVHLLHVGEAFPEVDVSELGPVEVERHTRSGDAVDGILAAAAELEVDLILMTTDGRDGFLDLLRGSHAERVVRGASCPVGVLVE